MKNIALIVAAGRGARLGADLPKQYLPLGGLPLIRRTVTAFAGHPGISAVRVVINGTDRALYEAALAGIAGADKILQPVEGGDSRQQSVANGLESLADLAPENVLIHDAARPFVGAALIDRCLDALARNEGVLPALAVTDTLKRGAEGRVAGTVDRDGLYRAQTPQCFRFQPILTAHRKCKGANLTDDVAVAEQAGLAVHLVQGSEENFKVTTSDDLSRAECQIAAQLGDIRVGQGFDVHRFEEGRPCILCGVKVPHTHGLAGHSDADVGLHALTDALLGAIGAGDIGDHFPPSDPQWAGASSDRFLRHAGDLVAARGGMIAHLDVTLICERPKVGPHRQAMRARVADILSLSPDRVSVKATTTEKLGFTGRGEGIAAQAVATVRLPA